MNTTSIQGIIFDWAGTVIDHGSCAPVRAFVQAFSEAGIEVTMEQARGPMGMAKRDHIKAVITLPEVSAAWAAKFDRQPTEADIDSIYETFLPLQGDIIAQYSKVLPGIKELVERLRAHGIKIGSSTGYTRELMDMIVDQAAADGFAPDTILTASDDCNGRPAPWMIYRACETLNVYPMTQVIKVDDTIAGIEAGRNAGCWTVGITRTGNLVGLDEADYAALSPSEQSAKLEAAEAKLRAAGAHFVIESSSELDGVIAQIEQALADHLNPLHFIQS